MCTGLVDDVVDEAVNLFETENALIREMAVIFACALDFL
jgi:hypothetical protein